MQDLCVCFIDCEKTFDSVRYKRNGIGYKGFAFLREMGNVFETVGSYQN